MQTFKLNVPIQIPANINTGKVGDTFKIALSFTGPKGNMFGQVIEITIKVITQIDEEILYKTAINLFEAGLGEFDECVEAVKRSNGDENDACQWLVEKCKKQ